MLQAKEGGETSCAEVYGFSLFPSAVVRWAEQSPAPAGAIRPFYRGGTLPRPTEVFPLVKRSFCLVYHSFC